MHKQVKIEPCIGCFRFIDKMYHCTKLIIYIRFELYYTISEGQYWDI